MARFKGKAKPVERRFAVADLGDGEAEITLYGDVLSEAPINWWTGEVEPGEYITTEDFNSEVESIKGAKHITVRLNSCGGDLYTGIAIHNVLKAHPARVTVQIDGIAASAASVIACAGDEVKAFPGSIFMIHEGTLALCGYYGTGDLVKLAEYMESGVKAMVNIYRQKTGRGEEEVRAWVEAETWFVGQDIIDAGFADVMDATVEVEEEQHEGSLTIAGVRHDVSCYEHVPSLSKGTTGAKPVAHIGMPPVAAEEREVSAMDAAELRAAYPDLVSQIERDAAQTERERIAAIDEIAATMPARMVTKAKYGKPCTAQELAYRFAKAQAEEEEKKAEEAEEAEEEEKKAEEEAKAKAKADTEDDSEESGAGEVEAEPTEDEEDEEEEARASIARAAKLFASIRK